ncbi:uncharacterized protein EI90DRAFT_3020980 [Cantharellus anzutake]|uniref:uncharacterized protein n=1 Tax=Cantharellus anzutake TaxID=1750568 RepID=UPI001907AC99|nr:uncharacterized protein EI90DRAFT_3020980 [Cantharellus anzutake]KAF8318609.1 hypothetical protein EI90DRAFT_3020980 [Cantharellus anzutake]
MPIANRPTNDPAHPRTSSGTKRNRGSSNTSNASDLLAPPKKEARMMRTSSEETATAPMELGNEDQSTPDPKTTIRVPATPPPTAIVITPAPGPVKTPNDTMTDFNVCPLPEGFNHRILGLNSMGRCHKLAKMGKAKDYATTFISHAFPASANTLCTILAANEIEECSDDPLPWGIMIEGLTYQDAATLLHYQLWFSKTFSFSVHPATDFTSDWLGNWDFAATAKDTSAALECLKATLSCPDTTIGRYLAEKVPDQPEQHIIIDSASVHWAFLAKSPHPKDVTKHHEWLKAAEDTLWYNRKIANGVKCNPPKLCRGCKGQDHLTLQ